MAVILCSLNIITFTIICMHKTLKFFNSCYKDFYRLSPQILHLLLCMHERPKSFLRYYMVQKPLMAVSLSPSDLN